MSREAAGPTGVETQELQRNPEGFPIMPFSPHIFRHCARHPGETLGTL